MTYQRTLSLLLLALGSACSVGNGTGEARGTIDVPECELSGAYDLEPDFFGAEFFDDGITIMIQQGGDYPSKSDGIWIDVPNIEVINDQLGVPFPVTYDPDETLEGLPERVRVSMYLNESCDRDQQVGLVGVAGQVTFSSIGNGSIDEADLIAGSFAIDFDEPAGHGATASLEGFFSFRYTRGRPAQRFP